jgi:hypothetical protein
MEMLVLREELNREHVALQSCENELLASQARVKDLQDLVADLQRNKTVSMTAEGEMHRNGPPNSIDAQESSRVMQENALLLSKLLLAASDSSSLEAENLRLKQGLAMVDSKLHSMTAEVSDLQQSNRELSLGRERPSPAVGIADDTDKLRALQHALQVSEKALLDIRQALVDTQRVLEETQARLTVALGENDRLRIAVAADWAQPAQQIQRTDTLSVTFF